MFVNLAPLIWFSLGVGLGVWLCFLGEYSVHTVFIYHRLKPVTCYKLAGALLPAAISHTFLYDCNCSNDSMHSCLYFDFWLESMGEIDCNHLKKYVNMSHMTHKLD